MVAVAVVMASGSGGARAHIYATPQVPVGMRLGGEAGAWWAIEVYRCSATVEAMVVEAAAMAAGCPGAGAYIAADPTTS
jgi:hypothetical protein